MNTKELIWQNVNRGVSVEAEHLIELFGDLFMDDVLKEAERLARRERAQVSPLHLRAAYSQCVAKFSSSSSSGGGVQEAD
jgi:hypothetical protein